MRTCRYDDIMLRRDSRLRAIQKLYRGGVRWINRQTGMNQRSWKELRGELLISALLNAFGTKRILVTLFLPVVMRSLYKYYKNMKRVKNVARGAKKVRRKVRR